MNATIGAHGTALASIDRMTAVVPHEQKGVVTAAATDPPTASGVWARKSTAMRSLPMYTLTAAAAAIPPRRNGQLWSMDATTWPRILQTRETSVERRSILVHPATIQRHHPTAI